jgi:hypothetical protein
MADTKIKSASVNVVLWGEGTGTAYKPFVTTFVSLLGDDDLNITSMRLSRNEKTNAAGGVQFQIAYKIKHNKIGSSPTDQRKHDLDLLSVFEKAWSVGDTVAVRVEVEPDLGKYTGPKLFTIAAGQPGDNHIQTDYKTDDSGWIS